MNVILMVVIVVGVASASHEISAWINNGYNELIKPGYTMTHTVPIGLKHRRNPWIQATLVINGRYDDYAKIS